MICEYIKFCANRLLIAISCRRHYKIGSPLELMEMISLQEGKQFFEKCVGEYSKSRVEVGRADHTFALDASFWLPFHTLILHPRYVYMLHNTLFQVENQMPPPIFTTFASMALQKTIHTGVMDVYESPMSFLAKEIHTPLCPNAINPTGSVMIF